MTEENKKNGGKNVTNREFIDFVGELARNDMLQTGILASLTIAQAILESGWGKSDLALTGNNLFGIKATSSWVGQVYNAQTKECFNGVDLVDITGSFKVYNRWEESIADHSLLLTSSSRYENVVGERDYKVACVEVKKAGYATASDYSEKLISLIEQYGLYEFDDVSEEVEANCLQFTEVLSVNTEENKVLKQEKVGKKMSHSSLISGTILSPHKSVRTGQISKIAIHCMAGNLSAKNCGDFFAKATTKASSHYGIGSDGVIFLYVDEKNRAWCTGGSKVFGGKKGSEIDHQAVTIEVANCGGAPDWKVSDLSFSRLVDLVEDIARRNGLKQVTFHENGSGTLQAHRWYAAKACPGDYLYERFSKIAETVTARLQGNTNNVENSAISTDTKEFTVRVTVDSLNIRSGGSVDFDVVGEITDRKIYTVVEEKNGWGRLKSGVGWICLQFTERV